MSPGFSRRRSKEDTFPSMFIRLPAELSSKERCARSDPFFHGKSVTGASAIALMLALLVLSPASTLAAGGMPAPVRNIVFIRNTTKAEVPNFFTLRKTPAKS